MPTKPSVLITGGHTGTGAIYADRFAKRCHDPDSPLPDATQWTDFEAARKVMFPNFNQAQAAARYRNAA